MPPETPPGTPPPEQVASPPPLSGRDEAERWLRVLGLLLLTGIGYYLIGLSTDLSRARELRTPLDDAIPFVPQSEFLYFAVYTMMLYPAFVVRDLPLFRRVTLAYLVVIVVSLACFALFPVHAVGLRADPARLDPRVFWEWGVRTHYHLDPPTNMFPSLHLSIAVLAGLSGWSARPAFGWSAAPLVAGIAVAICTVKQHFVLDGVAGFLLGAAAWATLVRRCPETALPEAARARTWAGPAAFLAFTLAVYGAMVVAWLLGWQPWVG